MNQDHTDMSQDVPSNDPSHTRGNTPSAGAADGAEAIAWSVVRQDLYSRKAASG